MDETLPDNNNLNKENKSEQSTPEIDEKPTVIEKTKRSKSSFFNQLKKKFTVSRKSKHNGEESQSNTPKHSKSNDHNVKANGTDCHESKSDKRMSGIRLSFGKGKSNTLKDDDKREESKSKELKHSGHSHGRPQSMHVSNTCPPRYGMLAGFGWYWGPLSRAEATHYLRHTDDGSFLVRDSEGDPNKFTLSFKGAGQIFHNRILRHGNKYAFLPDEEFDSIPDLIEDATRRSRTSAYCFSRSTDTAAAGPIAAAVAISTAAVSAIPESSAEPAADQQTASSVPNGNSGTTTSAAAGVNGSGQCKHEVRLLYPVSRYEAGVRSLAYLCRFMIRQYCSFLDLDKLLLAEEQLTYVQDSKFYV